MPTALLCTLDLDNKHPRIPQVKHKLQESDTGSAFRDVVFFQIQYQFCRLSADRDGGTAHIKYNNPYSFEAVPKNRRATFHMKTPRRVPAAAMNALSR